MTSENREPTLFVRCSDLIEAEVGREIVGLHVDRGQCYGLNEVASSVWRLLAHPISIDGICAELLQEYDIDEPTCRAEVERLMGDLRSEGLVAPAQAEGVTQ